MKIKKIIFFILISMYGFCSIAGTDPMEKAVLPVAQYSTTDFYRGFILQTFQDMEQWSLQSCQGRGYCCQQLAQQYLRQVQLAEQQVSLIQMMSGYLAQNQQQLGQWRNDLNYFSATSKNCNTLINHWKRGLQIL